MIRAGAIAGMVLAAGTAASAVTMPACCAQMAEVTNAPDVVTYQGLVGKPHREGQGAAARVHYRLVLAASGACKVETAELLLGCAAVEGVARASGGHIGLANAPAIEILPPDSSVLWTVRFGVQVASTGIQCVALPYNSTLAFLPSHASTTFRLSVVAPTKDEMPLSVSVRHCIGLLANGPVAMNGPDSVTIA